VERETGQADRKDVVPLRNQGIVFGVLAQRLSALSFTSTTAPGFTRES